MTKKLVTILMICLSVFILGACKDDEGKDLKDKKEEYQSKYDLEKYYKNEEELKIAKSLIGTGYKNFEGKYLNGSSFELSNKIDKPTILKVSNLNCSSCLNDTKENLSFLETTKEINFLTVFPNTKDVKLFDNYYKKTGTKKDENTHVVYTNTNTVVSDYQAQYPPMYYFIDKDGYIAFILFGEQTNISLSDTSDMVFGTKSSVQEGQLSEEGLDYFEEGQKDLEESIKDGSLDKTDAVNEDIMLAPPKK